VGLFFFPVTTQGCTHLHYSVYKKSGIEAEENLYSPISTVVCEHEAITILWNQDVLASRSVIIIKRKTDKVCLLINVAIPSDRNVKQKEAEKKLKYKNLSTEIQRLWNMKCFVIPAIVRATEIVTKGLRNLRKQHQENIQSILYKQHLYYGHRT
jgi:hypothetical protein